MKGRKPLPSNIIDLKGGSKHTHRPLRDDVPKPKAKYPACPPFLKGEARKEWNRLKRELSPLKYITQADRAILVSYCQLWDRYCDINDKIAKTGLLVKGKNGEPKRNPLLIEVKDTFDRMLRAMATLGITPVDRERVKTLGSDDKEHDEIEDLFDA